MTVTVQGLSASSCAGYFELRLCPLNGTTDAAEKKAFSEHCFARHPLKAQLPGGKSNTKFWMYHSGGCRPSAWQGRCWSHSVVENPVLSCGC